MNKAQSLLALAAAMDVASHSPYATEPLRFKEPLKIYGRACPLCGATGKTLYWNGAQYICHSCEEREESK